MPGYETLSPGQQVLFDFETAEQDGYAFRAVWPADQEPAREAPNVDSAAFRSQLRITDDEPGPLTHGSGLGR